MAHIQMCRKKVIRLILKLACHFTGEFYSFLWGLVFGLNWQVWEAKVEPVGVVIRIRENFEGFTI